MIKQNFPAQEIISAQQDSEERIKSFLAQERKKRDLLVQYLEIILNEEDLKLEIGGKILTVWNNYNCDTFQDVKTNGRTVGGWSSSYVLAPSVVLDIKDNRVTVARKLALGEIHLNSVPKENCFTDLKSAQLFLESPEVVEYNADLAKFRDKFSFSTLGGSK